MSILESGSIKGLADKIHLVTIILRVIERKENSINLSNCHVSSLPNTFFTLTEVMEFILSHNQITDLSPEWSALHVCGLALDYNKLTSFPSILKTFKCLKWLNLGHNPLKKISPEIGDVTSLNTLWLNCTEIDNLPKEIAQLTNLETFGARRNNLKIFPPELCYLGNLSWLTLANNNIQELPEEFQNLKNLAHLNLSHNYLKVIPQVLADLESLVYCDLSFNLIKRINEEILIKMSHVECLNLKGNELTDNKVDLKRYVFVSIDCMVQEEMHYQDSESGSEDWENSIESSELNFNITEDESDEQNNNIDLFSQVLSKVSKFS